jgi:hypothetical protein
MLIVLLVPRVLYNRKMRVSLLAVRQCPDYSLHADPSLSRRSYDSLVIGALAYAQLDSAFPMISWSSDMYEHDDEIILWRKAWESSQIAVRLRWERFIARAVTITIEANAESMR